VAPPIANLPRETTYSQNSIQKTKKSAKLCRIVFELVRLAVRSFALVLSCILLAKFNGVIPERKHFLVLVVQ